MALDWFRRQFTIDLVNGEARVTSGAPKPDFVSACQEVARLHKISTGRITCVGRGARARLRFSHGFPERGRQPVRNVWEPPKATRPGGRRSRG